MGLQRDLPHRVAFGGSRAEEYAGSSVSDPSAMATSALDTLLWAIAPAAVVALSAPLQPETLLTGGVMVAQPGNNHTSLRHRSPPCKHGGTSVRAPTVAAVLPLLGWGGRAQRVYLVPRGTLWLHHRAPRHVKLDDAPNQHCRVVARAADEPGFSARRSTAGFEKGYAAVACFINPRRQARAGRARDWLRDDCSSMPIRLRASGALASVLVWQLSAGSPLLRSLSPSANCSAATARCTQPCAQLPRPTRSPYQGPLSAVPRALLPGAKSDIGLPRTAQVSSRYFHYRSLEGIRRRWAPRPARCDQRS